MSVGRILLMTGLIVAMAGLLILFTEKANILLGRLPEDLVWRGKNVKIYFPWLTCLIISLLATLVLWLINRRP